MQTYKLRTYQIEGVDRLIRITEERHAAILADEPGLGKTAQVAEFMNRTRPDSVLIVCPASLRLNWQNELDRWLDFSSGMVRIYSYEQMTSLADTLTENELDLVVFDEAHYLKNSSAKRTKAGLALKAKTRLFLTGTPVVNRPMDLFPILSSIGIKMNRTVFGKRYCDGHLVCIRFRPRKYAWDFTGSSHEDELNEALRKHIMVRRTKAEVLAELPSKIRQVIELDIPDGETPELKEAVTRMFDGMESAAENLSELKSVAFTELSKARLSIAQNKLPTVIEFIRDLVEEEGKVVVFAHHREIIDALARVHWATVHYGEHVPPCVKLYGGMTDAQKDHAVRTFQDCPDCKIFIGQILAAGTGITLTAAHTVVFAELDWVPGNILQAEDRCHRLGQTDPVRVIHLVAKGSVDARMVRALVNKQNSIERIVK